MNIWVNPDLERPISHFQAKGDGMPTNPPLLGATWIPIAEFPHVFHFCPMAHMEQFLIFKTRQ
jgi:hypothetical protein